MDAGQWYKELPRFTRYWMTASIALSLTARFNILSLESLIFSRALIFEKFQLWRFITGLFVYPLVNPYGFHFLINCYFIHQYSGRLEKDQFGRSPADYLYLLSFTTVFVILGGLLLNNFLLMDSLVVAITYIWCHLNKDVIVTFWFGIRFKAVYLPWVLAGMELIMNRSVDSLLGIFVGHLYYFLKFQYPQELGGNAILDTPSILKQYLPDVSGGFSGFGIPPSSRAQPSVGTRPTANTWGRGNTLGH